MTITEIDFENKSKLNSRGLSGSYEINRERNNRPVGQGQLVFTKSLEV